MSTARNTIATLAGALAVYAYLHPDSIPNRADVVSSAWFELAMIGAAAAAAVAAGVASGVLLLASKYASMISRNNFDIDGYVRDPNPSTLMRAKVVLLHYLNVGLELFDVMLYFPLYQAPAILFDNNRTYNI